MFKTLCFNDDYSNFMGGTRDSKNRGCYVDHHGCPMKKILGFRWSEKVKIMLETISLFCEIFLSVYIYNFVHFYIQWKVADETLPIFQNLQTLLSGMGNNTYTADKSKWEKKLRKVGLCFITGCFIKLFKGTVKWWIK